MALRDLDLMNNRTNEEWLSDLQAIGQVKEQAVSDLRTTILDGLPYALSRWLSPADPKFRPFAEEVAQDTVLRILDKLSSFEGRSKFTTWAYKIAVRIALTELRRKRWQDVSLDSLLDRENVFSPARLVADPAPDPERSTEQNDMLVLVQRLISEELTDRQRQAMIAITIHGMPIEEVARRMNMRRNALYKLLHDARLRLKRRLAVEELTPEDILAVFELP